MRGLLAAAVLGLSIAGLAGCASEPPLPSPSPSLPAQVSPREPASPPAPTPPSPAPAPARTTIRYRAERRTSDPATADFAATLHAVLTDPRGWSRAGFDFVADPAGPYRIVLAEGAEVDALCLPYDTFGTYSCQNGPVVALNADRWRTATTAWTGDLAAYRAMLVNHEVGHLLHLHHPRPQCPGQGLPAPVMAQQSTELGACLANPWPLAWEVELAARRAEPLAPPADHDPSGHRPTAPPAAS